LVSRFKKSPLLAGFFIAARNCVVTLLLRGNLQLPTHSVRDALVRTSF
jgi:hypothetical protein